MNKLFVVILNFNSKDIIVCLQSLIELYPKINILKKLESQKIKIIKNKKNEGFAKGVNIGIKSALKQGAESILLLNPDTEVVKGFLEPLLVNKADIVGPIIKFKRKGQWIYDFGGKINFWLSRTSHDEHLTSNVKNIKSPDYISGCCLLIKKNVFEKIGLLNEKYFLFFEDVDFCLRAKKAGLKIALEPKSVIFHKLSEGKKKSLKYFYYLIRSNFIFVNRWINVCKRPLAYLYLLALSIKIFLNHKENLFIKILLIIALATGAFLRFNHLSQLMSFSGDEGRDFLIAKDIIINHKFPLLGPPTSLSWLRLGPLVYYFWAPVLWLGNFHPISVSILLISLDLLTILLLFGLTKEIFDKKSAVLVSFLYATSPFAIIHSRTPLHVNLGPFFTVLFFFFLWRFLKNKRLINFFICCFLLGVLVQVHLVTILLMAVFVSFILKKINWRQASIGFFVFISPLVSFLIADAQNRFIMLGNLFLWFPYRILEESFNVFLTVFQKIIFIAQKEIALMVFLLSFLFLFLVKKEILGKRLILLTLMTSVLAIFIHGQPAEHYFIFLMPLIIIAIAFFLSRKKIGIILALILMMVNVFSLLKANYYAEVPLSEQIEISKFIINDANSRKYQILLPPDMIKLTEYYKNYNYLTWWLGNESVAEEGELKYMIYHRKVNLLPLRPEEELIEFPHSIIVKSR